MDYYIRNIETFTAVKKKENTYLFYNSKTNLTLPLDKSFYDLWCFFKTPKLIDDIKVFFENRYSVEKLNQKLQFAFKSGFFIKKESPNDYKPYLNFQKAEGVTKIGEIDISEIKKAVLAVPEHVWYKETQDRENNFFCFTKTSHLLFKMHSSGVNHRKCFEKPIWNEWKALMLPIMDEVIKYYGYKKGGYPKAMFAKLHAKGIIDKHTDGAGRNLKIHKIHIPIVSNPSCKFVVNNEVFYLEPGGVYEVNNVAAHMVENGGDQDRIHFIFEYYNDDLW